MEGISLLSSLFAAVGLLYSVPEDTTFSKDPTGSTKIVSTNFGPVLGFQYLSSLGHFYHFFQGIPYALPPIGDLRYEPPVPPSGWSDAYNATTYGSRCVQFSRRTQKMFGSEDCLTLNIAIPSNTVTHNPFPVMIYFHGGHFTGGSSDQYNPEYFVAENVILVTMNYRLNSFGFLNTGDGVVSGNMGLKDQQLALKWVKDNIQYFNGDTNRMTLIGHSAGAACVHYHMLSPTSRGLFSRAISQSGTALSPWALVKNPRGQAFDLGKKLGCPVDSSKMMVECLKDLPAEDILLSQNIDLREMIAGKDNIFGPAVEFQSENGHEPFLSESPLHLMKTGAVAPIPWILGNSETDGIEYIIDILRNEDELKLVNAYWAFINPFVLAYADHPKKDEITAFITKNYMNNAPLSMEVLKEAAAMLTDKGFNLVTHDMALLHSKIAPTYLYYYSYQGIYSLINLLYADTNSSLPLMEQFDRVTSAELHYLVSEILPQRKLNDIGPTHGDEIPIIFGGLPGVRKPITVSDPDYHFTRKMVALWSSFAANGVPDVTKAGEHGFTWDMIETSSNASDHQLTCLKLDDNFQMIMEPYFERLSWWKQYGLHYLS